MNVLGMVVEYNPFHNGHLYHLEESKKLTGADYVVCVMSSNFIQRGEPSIVNKWARAKMALLSGADLVIELPVVYSMSSAEFFAKGAITILDSTGVVNCICFGSESGKMDELRVPADILSNEPEQFKLQLKEYLGRGFSYPSAREAALSGYINELPHTETNMQQILKASNNILGIEYLKALKSIGSSMVPYTVKRKSNTYNSESIAGKISSATSIRKQISNEFKHETYAEYEEALPHASLEVLQEEFDNGRGPVFPESLEGILLALLRKMSAAQIKELPYVSEGLENRIKDAAGISGTFSELVDNISTRRYPSTRIRRILFSILTGLTSESFDVFNGYGGPQYIRVLGFNKNGRYLLSKINKHSTLPVIIKAADFKDSCNPLLKKMLEIESQATDIYVLGYENSGFRHAGQEFTQNIIRI